MNPGYVIRFERGSRHSSSLAGQFLSWKGGYFTPCNGKEVATQYAASHIAKGVAFRAEQAFPGARFTVIKTQH